VRIFLSYAREQLTIAEHIAFALRQEGHTVFFDQDTIAPGEAFNEKIRNDIRRSDLFIFLISPDSVDPKSYARTELSIAEHHWPAPKGRIIPIMAEKTPWDSLPGILKVLNVIEARENAVPEVCFAVEKLHTAQKQRRVLAIAGCGVVVVVGGLAWSSQQKPSPDEKETPAVISSETPTAPSASPPTKPAGPPPDGDGGAGGVVPSSLSAAPQTPKTTTAPSATSPRRVDEPQDESKWRLSNDVTLPMVRLDGRDSSGGDFWIGETELTRAQWHAVTGASKPCEKDCTPNHPINELSPDNALEFMNRLSRHLDLEECYRRATNGWDWVRSCSGFRLPTDREWEIAADIDYHKAQLASLLHLNVQDPVRGYFCKKGNHGIEDCNDRFVGLAHVREFSSNRWGLYDTLGNVAERVWDSGSGNISFRGGAFNSGPDLMMSRDGDGNRKIKKNFLLSPFGWKGQGLRVARSAR